MTVQAYALTDRDEYYLASIRRMLPEGSVPPATPLRAGDPVDPSGLAALRRLLSNLEAAGASVEGPSLGSELVADNRNHLDCLIDEIERGQRASGSRA